MLCYRQHPLTIHYVNDFIKKLIAIIEDEPFYGSQRALAIRAGVDRAQLHRVLNSNLAPSHRLVGRIAAVLPNREGSNLIAHYLQTIAAEIAKEQKGAKSYVPPEKRRRRVTLTADK